MPPRRPAYREDRPARRFRDQPPPAPRPAPGGAAGGLAARGPTRRRRRRSPKTLSERWLRQNFRKLGGSSDFDRILTEEDVGREWPAPATISRRPLPVGSGVPILRKKRDSIGVWVESGFRYAGLDAASRPGRRGPRSKSRRISPKRHGPCRRHGPSGDHAPMNRSTVANRWNLELIEENYQRWSSDPTSVDATWQAFFEGYEPRPGRRRPGRLLDRRGRGPGRRHPPDRRLSRDRPLPGRPRPAQAHPAGRPERPARARRPSA